MPEPLIHMEGIKKYFVADEVETHALEGIHLDLQKGEYLSIEGSSGSKGSALKYLGGT